jgi:hypothetical protein
MADPTRSAEMTVTALAQHGSCELAYRENEGLEVRLFWQPETNALTVCVCDKTRGAYFEIEPEPWHGLDAFYHPYS